MLRKIFFIIIPIAIITHGHADTYADLIAQRNALKQQIAAVNSEIERCEKSLKVWKIATIVGGVGAVASGIGIIAQNGQIQENKKQLKQISEELSADEKAWKLGQEIGLLE